MRMGDLWHSWMCALGPRCGTALWIKVFPNSSNLLILLTLSLSHPVPLKLLVASLPVPNKIPSLHNLSLQSHLLPPHLLIQQKMRICEYRCIQQSRLHSSEEVFIIPQQCGERSESVSGTCVDLLR